MLRTFASPLPDGFSQRLQVCRQEAFRSMLCSRDGGHGMVSERIIQTPRSQPLLLWLPLEERPQTWESGHNTESTGSNIAFSSSLFVEQHNQPQPALQGAVYPPSRIPGSSQMVPRTDRCVSAHQARTEAHKAHPSSSLEAHNAAWIAPTRQQTLSTARWPRCLGLALQGCRRPSKETTRYGTSYDELWSPFGQHARARSR